jgi:hypothetical protein
MAEVARILNRRLLLQLAGPAILLNVPAGTAIVGRIEERSLQRSESSINNSLPRARNQRQGRLSGTPERSSSTRLERPGKTADYMVGVDIVGDWHGRAPLRLRSGRICAMLDASSDAML